MKQGSITQKQFANLKFPNLPYCHFNLRVNQSDGIVRSFHYSSSNTGVQLNVWWDKFYNTVTIARYNPQTDNVINVLECDDEFNQKILNEICRKYLG